jgi:hypothetical protein
MRAKTVVGFMILAILLLSISGCGGNGGAGGGGQHFQRMEYRMPPGAVLISWVTYSKYLRAGDAVTGSAQLTGTYYPYDWDYTWSCEVLDPEDNRMSSCSREWDEGSRCDLNFTASHDGYYKIRVSHVSFWSKDLVIEIRPTGWSRSGQS